MYKILIKNSQPFGGKCQKTAGGIFWTHTVYVTIIQAVHIGEHCVKISAYSDKNCWRRSILKMRTNRHKDRPTDRHVHWQ